MIRNLLSLVNSGHIHLQRIFSRFCVSDRLRKIVLKVFKSPYVFGTRFQGEKDGLLLPNCGNINHMTVYGLNSKFLLEHSITICRYDSHSFENMPVDFLPTFCENRTFRTSLSGSEDPFQLIELRFRLYQDRGIVA